MASQEILRNIKMSSTLTQGGEEMPGKQNQLTAPGPGLGTGTASVRMKLKKVDDYEAKDSQMNSVFGVAPRGAKNTHTLKVNPLYDIGGKGIVDVKHEDAKRAQDIKKRTVERQRRQSSGRNERQQRPPETPATLPLDQNHTKINYSKNFMYAKGKPGTANGNANSRRGSHIRNEGILMPARIQKNTPATQTVIGFMPEDSNDQITSEQDQEKKKNHDLEAVGRKARRQQKTGRIIILLLIAILILALLSALIIYFVTN